MKTRAASGVLALALLSGTSAACSSSGTSSSDFRAKTKAVLVKGGMPTKQADCYVKSLSNQTLEKFAKGDTSASKDPDFVKRALKCFSVGK